jgi:hypothetical protein
VKSHQRERRATEGPRLRGHPGADHARRGHRRRSDQSGPDRAEPGHRRLPRISLRCTDLPPVPAARQLGLAADSDRPQAEAAKARSGPERVLPSYSPCSDPRDRETNSSRFRPVSSGVLNLRKGMNRRSGSPGDLRNRSDSAAIGIGSVGRASRTRRRCSAALRQQKAISSQFRPVAAERFPRWAGRESNPPAFAAVLQSVACDVIGA